MGSIAVCVSLMPVGCSSHRMFSDNFPVFFMCQLFPPLRTWPGETWAVASDVGSVAECGGRIASTVEDPWDLEIPCHIHKLWEWTMIKVKFQLPTRMGIYFCVQESMCIHIYCIHCLHTYTQKSHKNIITMYIYTHTYGSINACLLGKRFDEWSLTYEKHVSSRYVYLQKRKWQCTKARQHSFQNVWKWASNVGIGNMMVWSTIIGVWLPYFQTRIWTNSHYSQ